jgi:hypothetical protein
MPASFPASRAALAAGPLTAFYDRSIHQIPGGQAWRFRFRLSPSAILEGRCCSERGTT